MYGIPDHNFDGSVKECDKSSIRFFFFFLGEYRNATVVLDCKCASGFVAK